MGEWRLGSADGERANLLADTGEVMRVWWVADLCLYVWY